MLTPRWGHIHSSLPFTLSVILPSLTFTPLFLFIPLSSSVSHPESPEAPHHVSDCQVRLQPGHWCQGQGSPSPSCLQQGHQDRRARHGILQSESQQRYTAFLQNLDIIFWFKGPVHPHYKENMSSHSAAQIDLVLLAQILRYLMGLFKIVKTLHNRVLFFFRGTLL